MLKDEMVIQNICSINREKKVSIDILTDQYHFKISGDFGRCNKFGHVSFPNDYNKFIGKRFTEWEESLEKIPDELISKLDLNPKWINEMQYVVFHTEIGDLKFVLYRSRSNHNIKTNGGLSFELIDNFY